MSALLRWAAHLLAPLTANCRDFHHRWAQIRAACDDGELTGRWEGEWVSRASGHRGPLRCVLEPADDGTSGERRWRACFRAGYAGVLRACYATELTVRRSEGPGSSDTDPVWTFSGASDIGWLAGGAYSYEGQATGNDFIARYRSRHDHGEFRLRRA